MNCESCGKQIDKNSSLCLRCADAKLRGDERRNTFLYLEQNKIKFIMGAVALVILFIGIATYSLLGSSDEKPELASIQQPVRDFLTTNSACRGKVIFHGFAVTEIGSFIKKDKGFKVNGWPVKCSGNLVCISPRRTLSRITSKFSGENNCAFLKKTAAGYEVFLPPELENAMRVLEREINKSY